MTLPSGPFAFTPIVRAAMRAIATILPWVLRHPFILRPSVWALMLPVALAGVILPLRAGYWFVAVAGVFGLATVAAGLIGWRVLTRPAERPLVVLTRFKPATLGATEASVYHQQALARRLEEPPLNDHLVIRRWPTAASEAEAHRLLDESAAQAVVFGTVEALGGGGTFDAQVLWRVPPQKSAHLLPLASQSGSGSDRRLSLDVYEGPPGGRRHETSRDWAIPVELLIAESFEAEHVDHLRGALLAETAEALHAEGDDEAARECLRAASKLTHLTPRIRASLAVTREKLDTDRDLAKTIERLISEGESGADDPTLWNWVATLSFFALLDEQISPLDHVGNAERAVMADPNNPLAHYNLAEALATAGRFADAIGEFKTTATYPEYEQRPYVHAALGNLAFNTGQYELAVNAYERLVQLAPAALHHRWLADAYFNVGRRVEARAQYRRALLLDPLMVDAHRGYWWDAAANDVAPGPSGRVFEALYGLLARVPVLPRRIRLVVMYWLTAWHARRHPEDTRIQFMRGSHALLLGRWEEARTRLTFAYEVVGGVDLEALGRLALAHGLPGDYQRADDALRLLRDAPSLENDAPPDTEELQARLINLLMPFLDAPWLLRESGAARLSEMILDRFRDVPTPETP